MRGWFNAGTSHIKYIAYRGFALIAIFPGPDRGQDEQAFDSSEGWL